MQEASATRIIIHERVKPTGQDSAVKIEAAPDRMNKLVDFEALGCLPGDMPRLLAPGMTISSAFRTTTNLGGAPIIMPARLPALQAPTSTGIFNGSTPGGMPPPLIAASEASPGLLYTPYTAATAEYAANYAALTSPLLAEYSTDPTGGLFASAFSHSICYVYINIHIITITMDRFYRTFIFKLKKLTLCIAQVLRQSRDAVWAKPGSTLTKELVRSRNKKKYLRFVLNLGLNTVVINFDILL
ncbi:hypothetical protein Anas_11141 [Armadillidium nasatum]|uniref:Uncharacterized protein n=1 Tax=Armadillidium nasatum TaxID=96803 RepID=A0A5N5T994_9CRUS|nr:hypothetical protein Anas_11141 [Armadillidium nasatum]